MYLLSPKVKRLGTKGSEDSEKFFKNTIKNYNKITQIFKSYGEAVASLQSIKKESIVKCTP